MNIGEQLVADYLEFIKGCQFVQQNLATKVEQGEIDIIGIDIENKIVYMCEVAIHLETGLQYTKKGSPNNVKKIVDKFKRIQRYAKQYFADFKHIYMLWTPIIKIPIKSTSRSQLDEIDEIVESLKKRSIELEPIINENFQSKINELKVFALQETKALNSPVMRLFQIDMKLNRHIDILK